MILEAYDASYDVDKYLPHVKKILAPLKGLTKELMSTSFGDYTDTIQREMTDAMSSLNLVVAALEEAQVEYEKGPLGGHIKPRSQRIDPETGEYLKKPSAAIEDFEEIFETFHRRDKPVRHMRDILPDDVRHEMRVIQIMNLLVSMKRRGHTNEELISALDEAGQKLSKGEAS
jgi:hypothetical protein